MRILCIIPARSGSVRLPNKNKLPFYGGESLTDIAYDVGRDAFDSVMISSDDPTMSKSRHRVFNRPSHLSGPTVDIADVAKHHMSHHPSCTHCAILQPTVPLRTPGILRAMVDHMTQNNCDSALTVTEIVPWLWEIDPRWSWTSETISPHGYTRSQDIPLIHAQEINACTIASREVIESGRRWGHRLSLTILPKFATIDIDTQEDFDQAQILYLPCMELLKNYTPHQAIYNA